MHVHPGHASPPGGAGTRAIGTAFALNLGFTLVELIGGVWVNSAAVLADALHDLGDCVILGAAWYLQILSYKGSDTRYTYGYGRFSMLGGWAGAFVLLAGSLWMLAEAVPRFWTPIEPHSLGMIALAVFGMVMNGLAAWSVHGRTSLTEHAAFLHLLEDVLGWSAVLVGGLVIHYTGWHFVDPLLTILICAFIIFQAIRMLHRSSGLLMQRTPGHVDLARLIQDLSKIPQVTAVRDVHAWSLDGVRSITTMHLQVNTLDRDISVKVREEARHVLHRHGLQHATIELEAPQERTANNCDPA
ncbi:MAG: cation transporter [Flavobacteriales bacterium]|nr:cation transporter [Flavobacteriales bacterium]